MEALLALFAETQRQQPVSRDLALSLVADLIERTAPEGLPDLEPLDTEELPDGPPDLYARAAAMLRQRSVRAVLDQVFITYRTDVVDRAYHQLRTSS